MCVGGLFFQKLLLFRLLHSTKEDGLLFLLAPRGSEIRESCRAQLPIVLLLQSCHGLVRVRRSRGSVHDSHVRLSVELLPFFFNSLENSKINTPLTHTLFYSLFLFYSYRNSGFYEKVTQIEANRRADFSSEQSVSSSSSSSPFSSGK